MTQATEGPEWAWYYTQHEERWHGGYATRQEALDAGIIEYAGEGFLICRARTQAIDFKIPGWRWLDLLDELNEEALDPDGDGTVFGKLTNLQLRALEEMVGDAIRAWADLFKLTPQSWTFAETRDQETIFATDAYDAARRRLYHLRLANMGWAARVDWRWNGLSALYPQTRHIVGRVETDADELAAALAEAGAP